MPAAKKRILIVDDERSFTGLLRVNLERTDRYEAREENDSRKAVEVAKEFRPDLILLDVVMPNMDGGQVLAGILADSQLKSTPVIFLTATISKQGLDARGRKIANYPFLAKPFDFKDLEAMIRKNTK
jgi:DNA-binding response OmpR family regulator